MPQKDTSSQPGDSAPVSAMQSTPTPAGAGTLPTFESEGLQSIYANFVKVTPSPEELVLEFGLNPNVPGVAPVPVKISERLVLNYFTAKRLWAALAMSVQRHEQVFGLLEIDVNKRVVAPGQQPAAR